MKWSRHCFEAFVLVALVVFVFLGQIRATIIPVIAAPVSLIGAFIVLWRVFGQYGLAAGDGARDWHRGRRRDRRGRERRARYGRGEVNLDGEAANRRDILDLWRIYIRNSKGSIVPSRRYQ